MLKWTVTALLATSSFAMLVDQKQTDTALLQEGDLYRSNAQIKQDSKPPEPKPPFELEWDEPHLKWYWWNTDTHEPTWRDPADTATMHCCTKSPDVGKKSRFICRKDGTTAHNPDNVKSICPSISEKTGQTAMRKTHSKHGDYMCKEETGAEGGVTVRREKKIISFRRIIQTKTASVVCFFLPSISKSMCKRNIQYKYICNSPPPSSLSSMIINIYNSSLTFLFFLHRVLFSSSIIFFCYYLLLLLSPSSIIFFFYYLLL